MKNEEALAYIQHEFIERFGESAEDCTDPEQTREALGVLTGLTVGLATKLVHQDARGEIYSLLLPTNQELMVFHCKAGYLRGGHSHDVPEVVLVLAGHFHYHKWLNGQEVVTEMYPGNCELNRPGEAHMGEFLEDTWLAEIKLGEHAGVGQWSTTDFEPFRQRVRESMK